MNIAFTGIAIMFLLIGYSFYNKAQKLPRTDEAELKEYKKTKSAAITFMFTGLTFGILAFIQSI